MLKIAVICAVYNEEVLLPQFLDYYSPQVDMIFLLDNESTDGSLEIAKRYPNVAVSRYRSNGKFSDVALSEAYNKKRRECAGQYDYVIIADCDEFVVPKIEKNIRDGIEKAQPEVGTGLGVEFFWTHGWNMWIAPGAASYDPKRSILSQCDTGIFSLMYSKPCIIRPGSLLRYEHGRHDFVGLRNVKPADMGQAHFHLLHYIGFDLEEFVRRGLERTTRFAQVNIMMGTSGQYLKKTKEDYRSYFLSHQTSDQLEKVPFDPFAGKPTSSVRRLIVGSECAPRDGWDTFHTNTSLPSTYRFDLMAPGWSIDENLYDELVVMNVLEYLTVQEAALLLRRFWRIMKVEGLLRLRVLSPDSAGNFSPELLKGSRSAVMSLPIKKTMYDLGTLKSLLFKAGFMDVEDVSVSHEDATDAHLSSLGLPISLKVRSFKQAQGGVFGWNR